MQEVHKRKKLVILGASLFAEEVPDIAMNIKDYLLAGFIECLDIARCQWPLSGLPVNWIEDLMQFVNSYRGGCAVGTTKRDKFIRQAISLGL